MKVKTTISFEVKIVKIEIITYIKIKNFKFDPLDFAKTLLAHIEKNPALSKHKEIKEIDINKINIFTGLIVNEKSNKDCKDSEETLLKTINTIADNKGIK